MTGYQFIGKATPAVQKQINTSLVYHYISEHSPCHRAMIAKELNLSAPAVSRAVDMLLERNDIIEMKKSQLENGKKVTQLQFNACKCHVIGIDLLRNPCRLVLADFSGKILKRWTGFSLDRETDITSDLIEETKNMMDSLDLPLEMPCQPGTEGEVLPGPIKAIGIGIPATVDMQTGVVLGTQRYDFMLGKNYGKSMSEAFGLPTYVDNITNMSAIAERRLGASKGIDHSVFFELSEGIGLGLFIQGRLFSGSFGAAGEIGYTPTSLEHLGFKSGSLGFLERTIAMEGIAQSAKTAGVVDSTLSTSESNYQLCTLAYEGNVKASVIIEGVLKNLVVLCANIILILNPQQIVFGGSFMEMPHIDSLLMEPLRQQLKDIVPFELPPILLSRLGDESGIMGAVEMAIDRLKAEWYPYRFDG